MSEQLIRWLRQSFIQIQDVQVATNRPEPSVIVREDQADLTVQTWMGSKLYIHLIQRPIKLRDLRGTLRDNSRGNVGTLFIVRNDLLPKSGATTRLDDWVDALQQLYDGFLYTYKLIEDEWTLSQLHFLPAQFAEQFDVWHNDHFEIQTVTVRRREMSNSLKGSWYVADIATPQYKRQINYDRVNRRYHYRTKYTGQANSRKRPPVEKLQQYYDLLGVEYEASQGEVKTAYRKLAMQFHPDVSESEQDEAEQRIKEINIAYEFIKDYHNWK